MLQLYKVVLLLNTVETHNIY